MQMYIFLNAHVVLKTRLTAYAHMKWEYDVML